MNSNTAYREAFGLFRVTREANVDEPKDGWQLTKTPLLSTHQSKVANTNEANTNKGVPLGQN
ncbi:hypothetical protein [Ferrimicrobium sp.]|uniref:hypothetical protein n=1 Tax=Ferrimicrobium sp. TaxID=2926050 RepID=UPI002607BD16|nr:hypothetical protein [Ferrimicrobium sp.]